MEPQVRAEQVESRILLEICWFSFRSFMLLLGVGVAALASELQSCFPLSLSLRYLFTPVVFFSSSGPCVTASLRQGHNQEYNLTSTASSLCWRLRCSASKLLLGVKNGSDVASRAKIVFVCFVAMCWWFLWSGGNTMKNET